MNPYALIVGLLAIIGSFFYGTKVGKDHEIASQTKTQELVQAVKAEAQLGAAEAIAKNRPVHTTIQQKAETIIRENKILTECRNPAELARLLDAARRDGQARPESASGDVVPSGPGRSEPR